MGKMKPEKKRPPIVEVTSEAHQAIDGFCEKSGRIRKIVASKVLTWFIRQPPFVQRVMLGEEVGMEIAYAEAMEAMAAELREKAGAPLYSEEGTFGGGIKPQSQEQEPNEGDSPADSPHGTTPPDAPKPRRKP